MQKKTRHAIIYDNRHGRNDGPPLYYFNQLRKLENTEVMHLLPAESYAEFGKFDYVWWIDWGEDAVIGRQQALDMKLPEANKTIYVGSDTHLDDGYRFAKAQQFQHVFFNQKHASDAWNVWAEKEPGRDMSNYLPHAAEPEAYPHFEIVKKYDIAFIGHMQEYHRGNGVNVTRLEALDYMFKKFPNFYYGSRNPAFPTKNMFEDAAKAFCQAKIVFNISVGNDLNMRFFETLVTGSFLLTNKIPELESAKQYGFEDGVHYVSYDSLEDAQKKAAYYIEHDEEREKIAKAGYEQALKTGTYKSRIEEVLKIVGKLFL